jgi:hypothetical protein
MTLQLLPSGFPYTVYEENIGSFFISVCPLKTSFKKQFLFLKAILF